MDCWICPGSLRMGSYFEGKTPHPSLAPPEMPGLAWRPGAGTWAAPDRGLGSQTAFRTLGTWEIKTVGQRAALRIQRFRFEDTPRWNVSTLFNL